MSQEEQESKQNSDRVSITLPSRIKQAVDEDLVGSIGTNRSDAISTALAIYLTEHGYLDKEINHA